jgi:hypothetical protein
VGWRRDDLQQMLDTCRFKWPASRSSSLHGSVIQRSPCHSGFNTGCETAGMYTHMFCMTRHPHFSSLLKLLRYVSFQCLMHCPGCSQFVAAMLNDAATSSLHIQACIPSVRNSALYAQVRSCRTVVLQTCLFGSGL